MGRGLDSTRLEHLSQGPPRLRQRGISTVTTSRYLRATGTDRPTTSYVAVESTRFDASRTVPLALG